VVTQIFEMQVYVFRFRQVVFRHRVTIIKFDATFVVIDAENLNFNKDLTTHFFLLCLFSFCSFSGKSGFELHSELITRNLHRAVQVIVQFFEVIERLGRREELSEILLEVGTVFINLETLPCFAEVLGCLTIFGSLIGSTVSSGLAICTSFMASLALFFTLLMCLSIN